MIFYAFFVFFLVCGFPHAIQQPAWHAQTPSGEQVNLDDSTKDITLFVFYGSYACHDCFHKLNDAISDVQKSIENARSVVIIRGDASMRRLLLHDSKIDFPNCREFYYDINDSTPDPSPPVNLNSGLWGDFGVTYCPSLAILLFKNGKPLYKYVSFDALFGPEIVSNIEEAHASLSARILATIHRVRASEKTHGSKLNE